VIYIAASLRRESGYIWDGC